MLLLNRLKINLRNLRQLYYRIQSRGYSSRAAILRQFFAALILRIYRKFAYVVNDHVLQGLINHRYFNQFQKKYSTRLGGHFYLIVMPNTLHFIIPCLDLIAGKAQVILLLNGASDWEAGCLQRRWPHLPQFRLKVLPKSSVSHGYMINMLLQNNEQNFGIIDHDFYLFDSTVLDRLKFAENECMLSILGDVSGRTGLTYPLTHFLYMNTAPLKELMSRYRVGAQSYRRLPRLTRQKLREIHLQDKSFLKDYHNFFDTLHVLLALAYAEGWCTPLIELKTKEAAYHLGGTSIGTHHTKELVQLYIGLLLLEFVNDKEITQRYADSFEPYQSSADVLLILPRIPEVVHQINVAHGLIEKLKAALQGKPRAA